MSSDEISSTKTQADSAPFAIRVRDVSKHYAMFKRPEDRFKQMVVPRLQRIAGMEPNRYFRNFAALHGVSLDVGRGETVGIVGRNGSGKSTLLQIICGTLQPTAGTVEVKGRIAALLELGAGFNPDFTGRENVFLKAAILGVPQKEMEWRFDEIARFADIGAFLDQPVKTYSSGMYVRLAFATAINVDPDILVVDEALAVGDEAFQRKCFARIEDIKDRRGTILFVSHGAQTIVQLCSRAILLDGGQKIGEGKPKWIVSQYQRLINAPIEQAPAIRMEIAALAIGAKEEDDHVVSGPPTVSASAPDANPAARKDLYDPSIVSKSALYYDENGGRIEDLRITRLDGTRVNVLVRNRIYQVRYRAVFSEDFDGVGFACLLKTVQGLELAGQSSPDAGERLSVRAGDVFDVCFPFRAGLLGSMYFSNAGIYTTIGEFRQIHRIIDGVAFRLLPDSMARARQGIVDLTPDGEFGSIITLAGSASSTLTD